MPYDVIVIGGGPGGYVAAIKAAQSGMETCLIEKGLLGGTCLNVGCIPTKALLKSLDVINQAKHAASFGVNGIHEEQLSLNLAEVQNRKNQIVGQLVGGVEGLLRKNGVTVIKGEACFLNAHTVQAGDQKIEGKNVIIAAGSVPKDISVETDGSIPVYNSTDILSMDAFPESMLVIGAGAIGIELAYFLSGIGVRITIVEFLDSILPMVDQEISLKVKEQFERMNVKIHTGARVLKIAEGRVFFEKEGKQDSVTCQAVLMAAGRSPNLKGLNLETVGVKTEKGAVITDDSMVTSVRGIYAIGDVNGKSMLAHTAAMEAITAVHNIKGEGWIMDYSRIPSVIYIKPEIASIGLTEEQAKNKYGDIKVGKFPVMANGKAKIEGEETGIVKIITESHYGEIIGVHLFCVHASDIIAEMSLAMKLECTAEELTRVVHPHPTISEMIHEAGHAAAGKAIHF